MLLNVPCPRCKAPAGIICHQMRRDPGDVGYVAHAERIAAAIAHVDNAGDEL